LDIQPSNKHKCFFPEKIFTVDSSEIWLNTVGIKDRKEGHPVVVFKSGYGIPMDNWNKVLLEEGAKDSLPNIPVHILTGGRFDMPKKLRSKEYDAEAVFRSKMKYRVSRWTDRCRTISRQGNDIL
jgi:hypothetical protein